MKTYILLACCIGCIVLVAAGINGMTDHKPLDTSGYRATVEPLEELSGGATTVSDSGINSFGRAPMNLLGGITATAPRWLLFRDGKGLFDRNWADVMEGRGALGPLFSAPSCNTCHRKDGRGIPPEVPDDAGISMAIQLSVADLEHGMAVPHSRYGAQLDYHSMSEMPAEGAVWLTHEDIEESFDDGEEYMLLRPIYHFDNLAYGELDDALYSPRVAPANFGLGLLEAIPESSIIARADPDDRNDDGISGRPNYVHDAKRDRQVLGRFGWKANQPTLEQQILKAFATDMGVTSALFSSEGNDVKKAGSAAASPELRSDELDQILFYTRLLAVPKRRNWNDQNVLRGKAIFQGIGCAGCHTPSFTTGIVEGFPEISQQKIFPYTDLLLHDMGDDLADGRPDGQADGNEWRTPPLWGIGLVENVNGHTRFLHDGRARNLEEAILWHGGESERSRDLYRRLSKTDRGALIAFLESL